MVRQIHRGAAVIVGQVVDAQDLHAQRHLRPDRIELLIEGLLRDTELRDPYRQQAVLAPPEQDQRCLDRQDLQHSRHRALVVLLQERATRIHHALERCELGTKPKLHGVLILVRGLQFVCRIELRFDLHRLHRRPGQAHRLRAVAPFGARAAHLQSACQLRWIDLKPDDARVMAGRGVHEQQGRFGVAGRFGKGCGQGHGIDPS